MSDNTRMRSTAPTVVTEENVSTIVRETLAAEGKIERNYAGLMRHYGLTPDSTSEEITAAAHAAVLAAYPDTDPDRLKGKNKNDDQRWKDARKIRAGLVRALKASAPDNDDNDAPKPVVLRVSLSGEGGGSAVIPSDHPLYPDLLQMIRGS